MKICLAVVMLCLVSPVRVQDNAENKAEYSHYVEVKGDTENEDMYESEGDSDEEMSTTTTTTTEKPELMLEGWHYAMFAVGSSLTLIFIGAGIGACIEIRRLRKADRLYCGCFDDGC